MPLSYVLFSIDESYWHQESQVMDKIIFFVFKSMHFYPLFFPQVHDPICDINLSLPSLNYNYIHNYITIYFHLNSFRPLWYQKSCSNFWIGKLFPQLCIKTTILPTFYPHHFAHSISLIYFTISSITKHNNI